MRSKPAPSWFLWVLFLLIPLQIFAYFNLGVSYKYEVDHAETFVSIDTSRSVASKAAAFQKIAQRAQQIRRQQRHSLVIAAAAAGALVALGLRNDRLRRRT
ncbi:hypothetical protein [Hymenobacter weizhouensis]|uniref:hypothetical protein n=1 Tax=Hymenobacter sp. YIM 151500-1 TaxID=2987689 RepID=UPI002225EC85|nr:hypothetical protein [Hymenobacter sp. YIM 151500-1]UYZ63875.1 hypothetical protein OIS53_03295 [Hymenobacter sp. YIM 151500-1]